jgi:actin-related protein
MLIIVFHDLSLHTDQAITLDAERFRCVECVFAPCMIGKLTLDLYNAVSKQRTHRFSPAFLVAGFSATGLTDNLYHSIYQCGPEVRYARPHQAPKVKLALIDMCVLRHYDRKLMWGNVVLNGGSTLFPGMAARLQKQLTDLAPAGTPPPHTLIDPIPVPDTDGGRGHYRADAGVRVIAPPERKYATWIGGSILASMPDFASMTVSSAAYAEDGTARRLFAGRMRQAQRTLTHIGPHSQEPAR